jgi:hypothetical protein
MKPWVSAPAVHRPEGATDKGDPVPPGVTNLRNDQVISMSGVKDDSLGPHFPSFVPVSRTTASRQGASSILPYPGLEAPTPQGLQPSPRLWRTRRRGQFCGDAIRLTRARRSVAKAAWANVFCHFMAEALRAFSSRPGPFRPFAHSLPPLISRTSRA